MNSIRPNREIAQETKSAALSTPSSSSSFPSSPPRTTNPSSNCRRLIPSILSTTPAHINSEFLIATRATTDNFRLGGRYNPQLPSVTVRVVNSDTFNAAIRLHKRFPTRRVCVLNMASQAQPGGGWLDGARAQEEQLCYRSTLSSTLHARCYPMPDVAAIYSPAVAVFRTEGPEYRLYSDLHPPRTPEVVSVISVAAIICRPADIGFGGAKYANEKHWKLMVEKIRMILRIAGRKGERRLVLGAFGCGAFGNPPRAVADIWKMVLREREFVGWWEEVVFAVYAPNDKDEKAMENLAVFKNVLDGLVV